MTAAGTPIRTTTTRPASAALHLGLVLQDERSAAAVSADLARAGLVARAGAVGLGGVEDLARRRPDAVVFVADVADPAALAALRRLRRAAPDTRTVVVARHDPTSRLVRRALQAGADAFVGEPDGERALAAALQATLAGLVCVPREARRIVVKPTFSQREKDVLALLVAGLSNGEIARRLFLAESTVKTHLASAFEKLGVHSRNEATALLLDPAEGLQSALRGAASDAAPAGTAVARALRT